MSRAAAIAIALAATGVYFHEPSRKFATHLVNGVASAVPKSSASNKVETFQPEANEDFDDDASKKKKKPTTNDANKPSTGGPNLNPVFPIKGHMFAIVTNGKDNKIHGLWPDFQSDPPKRAAPSCTLNPSSLTSDERNWVMSNYMDNGKGQMSMFSHEWNQHGCYGWKDVSTFIAATKVAFDAAKQGGNCAKCGKNGDYYQCYTPCSSLTSCKPGSCKSKWNIKKQKSSSNSFADDASKRKKAGDGSGCANAPSDTVLALVTNGQGVRLHGWWPGWGESYQWSDIDTSTLTAAQVATINSLYMPNNQGPLGMFQHEWKCHGSRYFADVDSFLAASQTALQTATKAGNCASTCNQDGDWHDCRVPCTDANTCSASKSCSASSWTPAPDDFNADGARKAAAPAAPAAAAADGFDDNAAKKKKKPAANLAAAASSQPPLVVAWLTNSADQPKLHGMWPNYPPGQDNVGECCSESNTWNCALPQVSDDDRQYIMDNWLSPSNPKQNQMDMFGHEWWTHGCEGYADTASFLKDVRVAFASAQQASSNCDYNQQVYQDCDSINDCSQYTGVCKSYWKQPGN